LQGYLTNLLRINFHFRRISLGLMAAVLLSCWPVWAQDSKSSKGNTDPRAFIKPDPKRAQKLSELGDKEVQAAAYEQALAAYEEAARYAPFDVTIVQKAAELRSKLVHGYVDSAEREALDGSYDQSIVDLGNALRLDASNTIVLERLKQIESLRANKNVEYRELPPEGLPKLQPAADKKSFNLRGDLKSAFEQVAGAFGLKAAFDPDLQARSVRLQMDAVDFDAASRILTEQTGTFIRPLSASLFFVAADTPEKRKAFDLEIEQTFQLPSSVDSGEVTDVVRALRELTGVQHIQPSLATHSVTIRDTVQRVQLAGQIIHEVEQGRGEVLLEIDLLEVDRNNASKIGVTPPSQVKLYTLPSNIVKQVQSAPSLTALLTILAGVFGGPLGSAAAGGLASAIPPVVAIGGGKSLFLLSLPSATVDFAQGLSLVHSGRQVLLRAQDGKPATFFVGDRYPITLSLLSGSLGGGAQIPNIGGVGIQIPTQQFNVGQGPVALVAGEFHGASGLEDLVVVNQVDNTLSVLLNQGTGITPQFLPATNSPLALPTAVKNPIAIATADFNTDAIPDLAIAFQNSTDATIKTGFVEILKGNGDGTFASFTNTLYPTGVQPSAIGVGEFNTRATNNANSNQDFVVTNFADNTYSVFLGNNDGTFTQATGSPFALPTTVKNPVALTVNDFNSDGISDLAILCQAGTTTGVTQGYIVVLKGNGDGTFAPFPNTTPLLVGNGPAAISSGLLAGSTGPALAVANKSDNTMTVWFGNGDGTFVQALNSPFTTDTAPDGIVIADFLQQSNGGIAVSNSGVNTVSIFVDAGAGLIVSGLETAAGTSPGAIVANNFTNSSFPDIMVANNISGSAGTVTLIISPTSLISNGAGIAQQPYPGSEYVDIGLKIKATPSLHANNEVTLQLDFEIKALSGTSVNGIPVISNRTLTQTVRLREDETTLLTGMLDDEETKTITGLPGFAEIPGVGYLFGRRDHTFSDSQLLILLTPRKVRQPVRESKTIYAGRGDAQGRSAVGGGSSALPPPPQEPVPATPQPAGNEPANNPPPIPAGNPPQNPPTNQPGAAPIPPSTPLQEPPQQPAPPVPPASEQTPPNQNPSNPTPPVTTPDQ
jgi:type II secretory pathway component GspD/PulD (secretin)